MPFFLSYRFGDSIRHNNVPLNKGTFAHQYYNSIMVISKPTQRAPGNNIQFDVLRNIVLNSQYKTCPDNSMLIHLRLFDWISWPWAGKIQLEEYLEFIEKKKELIQNLDKILILYGCTVELEITKTQEFVQSIVSVLKKINKNVEIFSTKNVDQDFKYMVTSKYYVPSMGGFTALAGALNRNTVFWDLSEKYFNTYISYKDKQDALLFKRYQEMTSEQQDSFDAQYKDELTYKTIPIGESTSYKKIIKCDLPENTIISEFSHKHINDYLFEYAFTGSHLAIIRLDKKEGWDINLIAYYNDFVFVGKSETNEKIIDCDLPKDTIIVEYSNLRKKQHDDAFTCEFTGKYLKVKRLDRPTGWGQELIIFVKQKICQK